MPAVRKIKKSKQEDSPYDLSPASADSSSEQDVESSSKRSARKRMERKGPWLPAEDAVLVALVNRLGAHSWSKIATHIPGRVGKQCRERYYNHLAPEVNKEPWTPEEELKVMKLHAEHGNSWAMISRLLNTGRTANDVKNLWNCALKKRLAESGEEEVMAETQAEVESGSSGYKRRARADRERKSLRRSVPACSVSEIADTLSMTASPFSSDDECSPASTVAPSSSSVAPAPMEFVPSDPATVELVAAAVAAVQQASAAQQQQMAEAVAAAAAPAPEPQAVPQHGAAAAAAEQETFSAFLQEALSSPSETGSVVAVSPPQSVSPSPFVSSFEFAQEIAASSEGQSLFDANVKTEPTSFFLETSSAQQQQQQDVSMWWAQDIDGSSSESSLAN